MNKKLQQGSVLLWGLVILLTLTVLGVSAIKMSTTDNRIAGNQLIYLNGWEDRKNDLQLKSGTAAKVLDSANKAEASGNRQADLKWYISSGSIEQTWSASATDCSSLEGVAISTRMNGLNLSFGALITSTHLDSHQIEQWCVPIRN